MSLKSQTNKKNYTGSIEVICGPMFSGKTEELLRRLNRVKFTKLKVSVFKPKIDTRYDDEKIVSHDSSTFIATPIKNPSEILSLIEKSEVVAIDEAQFFNNELIEVCNEAANNGKRVIVTGLDMDFLGKPFSVMPYLLAIAENITKLNAICVDCGDIANYSFRITKQKSLIQLGEKKEYKPLCRKCFNDSF